MQLIPVLDLLDGHAVRAERGKRDHYRPIRSSLAATSEPVGIARALVAATGSETLYVADLGAILQRGAHAATLAELCAALPGVEIWLDAGFADYAALCATLDAIGCALAPSLAPALAVTAPDRARLQTRIVPVFGTESLRDTAAVREAERDGYAPVLSLDHRAGHLLTAGALDNSTSWWPKRVISMTLDHVGSYAGPDLATLERLRERAPRGTQLIGAGGIRDRRDLQRARASGAHAWLVASALHDRRVDLQSVVQIATHP